MTPPRSASAHRGGALSLRCLLHLDEWTIRRARGRLGSAMRTLLVVTAGYALGWIVVFVGANLLVGPHDAWPWYLTVPMVVLEVPWLWAWMPTQWWASMTVSGWRRLGLRRGGWALYIAASLLAIIQLSTCIATMFATFAPNG